MTRWHLRNRLDYWLLSRHVHKPKVQARVRRIGPAVAEEIAWRIAAAVPSYALTAARDAIVAEERRRTLPGLESLLFERMTPVPLDDLVADEERMAAFRERCSTVSKLEDQFPDAVVQMLVTAAQDGMVTLEEYQIIEGTADDHDRPTVSGLHPVVFATDTDEPEIGQMVLVNLRIVR